MFFGSPREFSLPYPRKEVDVRAENVRDDGTILSRIESLRDQSCDEINTVVESSYGTPSSPGALPRAARIAPATRANFGFA